MTHLVVKIFRLNLRYIDSFNRKPQQIPTKTIISNENNNVPVKECRPLWIHIAAWMKFVFIRKLLFEEWGWTHNLLMEIVDLTCVKLATLSWKKSIHFKEQYSTISFPYAGETRVRCYSMRLVFQYLIKKWLDFFQPNVPRFLQTRSMNCSNKMLIRTRFQNNNHKINRNLIPMDMHSQWSPFFDRALLLEIIVIVGNYC